MSRIVTANSVFLAGCVWLLAAPLVALPGGSKPLSVQPALGERPGELLYQGKGYAPNALPVQLSAEHKEQLAPWLEWARANDSRGELDASGTVLLLVPASEGRNQARLELVDRTLKSLDSALGKPAGAQPALLILAQAQRTQTMGSLAESIAKSRPELSGWASNVHLSGGFLLSQPLIGAWTLEGEGREEFDPAGELVHRLAKLYCMQRFGRLPHWIATGIAWHLELSERRKITCFPYRNDFVSVNGHDGWESDLGSEFQKRAKQPLEFQDLAALARGSYQETAAAKAWGAASYWMTARTPGLAAALAELGAAYETESVITKPDGSWERDVHFELSPARQTEILSKHLGPAWLGELHKAFASGIGRSAEKARKSTGSKAPK